MTRYYNLGPTITTFQWRLARMSAWYYCSGTRFYYNGYNTKLSCRREAARCFVFVCSQLQHTYSAVFLLLVTAASDLLVHKILLNYVLLSPIVSGGVRPKLPGQTPLGHNPLVFCRSWVGWGQDPASWVG